ncbi:MAG TPA: hypothetical protein VGI79_15295 [Caulobacteraceae bacterium]
MFMLTTCVAMSIPQLLATGAAIAPIVMPLSGQAAQGPQSTAAASRIVLAQNNLPDAAPLGSAANPIPLSSPTPAELAYRLKAGDPNAVSNQPIPTPRSIDHDTAGP